MLQKPYAVMSKGRLRPDIKSGQLPSVLVLEDGRQRVGAAAAGEIQNHDAVLAHRKTGNVEGRAVGAHAVGLENAAVKTAIGRGTRACVEQECVADLGLRPGKGSFVVADGGRDSVEVGLQRGNGVGFYSVHVPGAGMVKNDVGGVTSVRRFQVTKAKAWW